MWHEDNMTRQITQLGEMIWQPECGVIVTQIQQGRITYAQLRAAASLLLRPIVWLPSTSGPTSSQPSVAAAYATHCCGAARATGSARGETGGAGFALRSLHH